MESEPIEAEPIEDELTPEARVDRALARSFCYQFLAKAFEDPDEQGWFWLTEPSTLAAVLQSVQRLPSAAELSDLVAGLKAEFHPENFEGFATEYISAFGHAARGRCPMNEIEYSDANADPLFQPHRLADLAAFYRGFGLQVTDDAAERQDHLCIQLEFMSVLAAKEAYAAAHRLDRSELNICLEAQKKFLREHLGRWAAAFAGRLAGEVANGPLAAAARVLRAFIQAECRLAGITPGNDVLHLRPIDEAAESLCGSCGLQNLPPGAAAGCST